MFCSGSYVGCASVFVSGACEVAAAATCSETSSGLSGASTGLTAIDCTAVCGCGPAAALKLVTFMSSGWSHDSKDASFADVVSDLVSDGGRGCAVKSLIS